MSRTVFEDPVVENVFRLAGYHVMDLLNAGEAAQLRDDFLQNDRDAGLPFYTTTGTDDVAYRRRHDAMIRSAIERKLEDVLEDYEILYSSFIVKKRRLRHRIGLHADWQFVDESQFQALNVWIALENLDKFTGTLKVIPGSHHLVQQHRGPNYLLDRSLNAGDDKLITLPLKKGQAIFYDTRLLHASGPNLFRSKRVVASALVLPREATAKYYYFDPVNPRVLLHEHNVSRHFYLERCIFNRTADGWPYAAPERTH